MRKLSFILASIFCLAGCAKQSSVHQGELARNAFEAWAQVNKESGWQQTELGSWVIEMDKGTGASVKTKDEIPYVRLHFTISDLKGNISSTSREEVAKQLGTYDKRTYFGPAMTYRGTESIYAGVEEVLDQMNVGGHCKVAIPGWLLTGSRYKNKQGYINAMTEAKDALVYDFTIVETVADENVWELDQIKAAMGGEAIFAKADSLAEGVYYIQDSPSDKPDTTFTTGNKVYFNYNCRRIDGVGIDTNNADLAKDFGCYKAGNKYEPVLINWAEETATDITMGSSSSKVVAGFALGIHHMRPHEKGRVYMTSGYAYETSGSGNYIPGYCPIYFELEFTDEPKK